MIELETRKPDVERRECQRFPVAGMVYYSAPSAGLSGNGFDMPHVGIANDMSACGAGILTKHFFCTGEFIKVSFQGFGKLTVTGTVRWCRRYSGHMYRVGIDIPSFY